MKDLALKAVKALMEMEAVVEEINSLDERSLVEFVRQSWMFLKFIERKNQTEKVCAAALEQSAEALKFIKISEEVRERVEKEERDKAVYEWEDYVHRKKQEEERREKEKERREWLDKEEREAVLDE